MKNNFSLVKFVNAIVLFGVFFFAIFIFMDMKNIAYTLKELQKDKAISIIKAKNDDIASLLKYEFYDELKYELKKLSKKKFIVNIELQSNKFNFKTSNKISNTYVEVPIVFKSKEIGKIKVYYKENLVEEFFKKYFHRFIIYLIVFGVFFFLLTFIGIQKIKKLSLLANKLKKVNFKKNTKIEYLDTYLEIRIITDAVNKLLNQVYNYYVSQKKLLKDISLYRKQLESAQRIIEMISWEYLIEDNKFVSKNFKLFRKKFNKNIDEFFNSFDNKEELFNKFQQAYKEKSSFSLISKIEIDNKVFYFKTEAKYLFKDRPLFIGATINITEEIKKQKQIEFLAYHDTLTGLKNRTFLKEKLQEELDFHNKYAFVFLDLDNFKYINDTFGHEVGDELLVKISEVLKSISNSIALRIGGDEFLLVLENIDSKEEIIKVIEYIQESILQLKKLEEKFLEVTFSIGIALYPDDSKDVKELIRYADIAMYEAKKNGKNRYYFIEENMKKYIEDFYITLNNLKQALKKDDELILFYQPKVDIETDQVVGVEALIRWYKNGKFVSPGLFIPYAEKGGLITKIDSYVLRKAIQTLSLWQKDEFLKNIRVAINISSHKFKESTFIEEVLNLLKTYQVDPSKLEIEITETMSIEDLNYTKEILNKLRKEGISIAIDDFGTGYSSLNYLKEIPFDVLKIDQTFVRHLHEKENFEITKMIVNISKLYNKINVAEGVEDKEILEIVKNLGIKIVQGYYFSKPLPENELKEFIKNFGKTL